MISTSLAQDLALAGLRWDPEPGDRFSIEVEGLEDDIFTVSDITVEVHEYPGGTILGFNGTTEWALDSVSIDQSLWLPREDQMRDLLGGTFRSLTAELRGEHTVYTVTVARRGTTETFESANPADAYAQALHELIAASVDHGS